MNSVPKFAVAMACVLASMAVSAQDADRRETFLRLTGGLVEKPADANAPSVVIVDARKAPDAFAGEYARKMARVLMLPVKAGQPKDGDFVLTIADGGDLVVMPERRQATVPAGADAAATEARLNKALMSLLAAGINPARLEGTQMILNAARQAGISSPRRVPYKLAVKEGWAPPPTNDFQKAIWDAAHTNAPAAK